MAMNVPIPLTPTKVTAGTMVTLSIAGTNAELVGTMSMAS